MTASEPATGGEARPVARRGTPVPVRPAATVLLVRDGPGAVEVCMLRRNLRSEFVAGAYVFPGGGVDDADGDWEVAGVCDGWTDADASARLGLTSGGLAYWVAAVRESFEEAGLLLATRSDGTPLSLTDPQVAERFVQHRRAVDDAELTMVELCRREDLHLDLAQMHYFGHWITPIGAPRRYDTRFFLAPAPQGQQAVQDDHEVISSQWVVPEAALAEHAAGTRVMLPPTVASLKALTPFTTAEEAIAATAARATIPTVTPRVVDDADGIRVLFPGDPGYEEATAVEDPLPEWQPGSARH